MPRAIERQARELGGSGDLGWILVAPPAAGDGWHQIRGVRWEKDWMIIECGRGAPYVIPPAREVWWSPVEPPQDWWKPW